MIFNIVMQLLSQSTRRFVGGELTKCESGKS